MHLQRSFVAEATSSWMYCSDASGLLRLLGIKIPSVLLFPRCAKPSPAHGIKDSLRRASFMKTSGIITKDGALTERLRRGLQNLLNGFDSHTCLHFARMAELVDARDLKSLVQKTCGFDSRSAHQTDKNSTSNNRVFSLKMV